MHTNAPGRYRRNGHFVSAVRYTGTPGHRDAILEWLGTGVWPRYVSIAKGYEPFDYKHRHILPGDWVILRDDGAMTSCSERDFTAFHSFHAPC